MTPCSRHRCRPPGAPWWRAAEPRGWRAAMADWHPRRKRLRRIGSGRGGRLGRGEETGRGEQAWCFAERSTAASAWGVTISLRPAPATPAICASAMTVRAPTGSSVAGLCAKVATPWSAHLIFAVPHVRGVGSGPLSQGRRVRPIGRVRRSARGRGRRLHRRGVRRSRRRR